MKYALLLFALVACAPANPYDEPAPERRAYRVIVVNESLDVMTVTEVPARHRTHVYPGETRGWDTYADGERYLAVRLAAIVYYSAPFSPSETFPCWRLLVSTMPAYEIPSGPVPCRER